MNIKKIQHAAGGYILTLTEGNGNTRFGESRKSKIIRALNMRDTDVEGVYIRTDKKVVVQYLNGAQAFI